MEGGVFVEDALDPIVAGGKVAKIGGGIAEEVIGDDGVLAGGEGVGIGAEDLLGLGFYFEDLGARLGIFFGGDDDVDAAVKGSGAEIRIEGDGETRLRGWIFCGRGLRGGRKNCGRGQERCERSKDIEG